MITPAQHAEIRRLYFGEHWKIGTIAAALGVHHTFERTPCLKLGLSFLKVRWRARSVSLSDRARGYRKEIPMPPAPEPPDAYRGPATFSRFIGRR